MLVWQRVYFYGVIEAVTGILLFMTPVKKWLAQMQKTRVKRHEQVTAAQAAAQLQRPHLKSEPSYVKGGMLGMPDDPGEDVDDFVEQLKEQVNARSSDI